MRRKVNSFDVARAAGVSQATVSYVLNGRSDQMIREETRQRVLEAARALGYRPNLAARTLVTGKTGMVALWVPFSFHSVYSHVMEQIVRLAKETHYRILVAQIHGETSETLNAGGLLSAVHVDGILAFDTGGLVGQIAGDAQALPAIVSFGPTYSPRVDHVGIDLYGASLQAVRHLRDSGCHRIAHATDEFALSNGDVRVRAYIEVMAESGLEPEVILMGRGDFEDSYRHLREYFDNAAAQNAVPDGLFCWNDEAAIGANRALADLGLRVPDDVAIIGSDGIRETLYSVPALSTMSQPFEEMCALAWDYLMKRLQDPAIPIQQTVLPMRLEQRASTERAAPRSQA